MKTGKTLSALAAEIDRQSAAKRDFVAATRSLEMVVNDEGAPALAVPGVGSFQLNGHAGGQLANHLDIPKRYYDRLSGASPALLADNVNHWLRREDSKARRNHVGRAVGGSDGAEIFATDTLRADVKAFLLRLRDVIRATVDQGQFDAIVQQMADAAAQPIEGDVVQVVEVTAKRLALSEGEKSGVLRHLIQGGDLSRWGLANAVTRAAEDCTDYDRASDLEALGGRLIELPQASWREIATAA